MGRILPVMLALLLALAVPALAASATTHVAPPTRPSVQSAAQATLSLAQPGSNTTSMLTFDDGARVSSAFVSPSLDLGSVLDRRNERLHGQLSVLSLRQRFSAAGSATEKRAVLANVTGRTEQRVSVLLSTDRASRRAFVNGSLTGPTFLRRLARDAATANRLRAVVTELASLDEQVSGRSVSTRLKRLDTQLGQFQGPVYDRLLASYRGDAPPTRIYTAVSSSGVVLAMLNNGTYVREAIQPDRYVPRTTVDFPSTSALLSNAYPWASERNVSVSRGVMVKSRLNLYVMTITYPYGHLTASGSLDSQRVFREVQYQSLAQIPFGSSVGRTEHNLTVLVNRTYPGGPMAVLVRNATSGNATTATISVDGAEVGYTGIDGRLWTIQPRTTTTLTVTHGLDTVNLTLRPRPPSPTPTQG